MEQDAVDGRLHGVHLLAGVAEGGDFGSQVFLLLGEDLELLGFGAVFPDVDNVGAAAVATYSAVFYTVAT